MKLQWAARRQVTVGRPPLRGRVWHRMGDTHRWMRPAQQVEMCCVYTQPTATSASSIIVNDTYDDVIYTATWISDRSNGKQQIWR